MAVNLGLSTDSSVSSISSDATISSSPDLSYESLNDIEKLKNLSILIRDTLNKSFVSPPKERCYRSLDAIDQLLTGDSCQLDKESNEIQNCVKEFFTVIALCHRYGIVSDNMTCYLQSHSSNLFIDGYPKGFLLQRKGNSGSFTLLSGNDRYLKVSFNLNLADMISFVDQPGEASSCRFVKTKNEGWYYFFAEEFFLGKGGFTKSYSLRSKAEQFCSFQPVTYTTVEWIDRLRPFCDDVESMMARCASAIQQVSIPTLISPHTIDNVELDNSAISEVREFIDVEFPKMKGLGEGDQVIYVMGPLENGKGSLINYILGHKIKKESKRSSALTLTHRDALVSGSFAEMGSHTRQPQYVSNQEFNFCDFVHIEKNPSQIKRMGMEVTKELCQGMRGCLIVVKFTELEAHRGVPFITFMKDLVKIFQDYDLATFKERVVLIFNGSGCSDITVEDVVHELRKFERSFEDEKILALLEQWINNPILFSDPQDLQAHNQIKGKIAAWSKPIDPKKLQFDALGNKRLDHYKDLCLAMENSKKIISNERDRKKILQNEIDSIRAEINLFVDLKNELSEKYQVIRDDKTMIMIMSETINRKMETTMIKEEVPSLVFFTKTEYKEVPKEGNGEVHYQKKVFLEKVSELKVNGVSKPEGIKEKNGCQEIDYCHQYPLSEGTEVKFEVLAKKSEKRESVSEMEDIKRRLKLVKGRIDILEKDLSDKIEGLSDVEESIRGGISSYEELIIKTQKALYFVKREEVIESMIRNELFPDLREGG